LRSDCSQFFCGHKESVVGKCKEIGNVGGMLIHNHRNDLNKTKVTLCNVNTLLDICIFLNKQKIGGGKQSRGLESLLLVFFVSRWLVL
jgi:hypothetical protein